MSRGRNPSGLSGLVVVDKDLTWTSHDVVAKLRGMLRERRVGHAGTLDPGATGVLLVGVGPATRLLRYLQGSFKTYEGTIQFGSTTDSLDADGVVTKTFAMTGLGRDEVEQAARSMIGESLQVPPMVSALKVEGQRLHELARQGIEIEREARPITIESFEVQPSADPLVWTFEVRCSSGTYVRSIADDLGRSLGGGAHLTQLRRTRNDRFGIDDALSLAVLEQRLEEGETPAALVLSPAEMLSSLAAVTVDETIAASVANGATIPYEGNEPDAVPLRVLDASGLLLGIYCRRGNVLRADVVLPKVPSV